MPVTVRCPCCSTALEAPDELVGTSARCEDCGQTFVVRRPKAKAPAEASESVYPYRYDGLTARDPDDEDEPRPRPRRKRPAARRPNYAPLILAGVGMLGLFLVVAGGLAYYLVANRKPDPPQLVPGPVVIAPQFQQPQPPAFAVPAPPAAPGNGDKVTLSNPRWAAGIADFQVDYAFAGGQRPFGGFLTLVFQGADGNRGTAMLHLFNAQGTVNIHVVGMMGMGGRRGPLTLWVEEGGTPGPFGRPGAKVSNTVTLN